MERAFLGKVSQGLRLAPTHGAAHRPPTFAQAHRHQRVLFAARQIAGRQTRPGKAQQQPAAIQPIQNAILFRLGQAGDIGEDDHIGLGGQNISQGAIDKVGHRHQRLAQVMGGRQQLQPLAVGAVVDHRDLAALQTVIGQRHCTRAALAQEGKAIDPVAQFGRHVQLGCRLTAAGGKDQPRAAQLAVNPGRVGAMGGDLQLGPGGIWQAQGGQGDFSLGQRCGAQAIGGTGRQRGGHLTTRSKLARKRGPARMVQPIRQPKRVKSAFGQHSRPRRKIRRPWRRLQRGQSALPLGRVRKHNWLRRIGQARNGGGTPGARGLFQGRRRAGLGARPIAGIGPAAIQKHQHRSGARLACIGVQNRPGKADDRRRHREHPEQQKPPRRLVGLAILIFQPQHQGDSRKAAANGSGRNGAQQQPQDRQRDQRQKKPGRGKGQGTKGHRLPPASA